MRSIRAFEELEIMDRKDIALIFGIAASLTLMLTFGTAIIAGTNKVLISFPFNEHYIEFVLSLVGSVLGLIELFK